LGVVKDHNSRWYAQGRAFADNLNADIAVRELLRKQLAHASVSRIEIERPAQNARVIIHTARPGIVIGKKGAEVDVLRKDLEQLTGHPVAVNIVEIKRPEIDATLVAQSVAEQLVARVGFRRAMKKAVTSAMKGGALGVRIQCSGRLGGAEMGRREWYREGRVPLHTLRAKIDYGTADAVTTFGVVGVKVWVYRGDKLPGSTLTAAEEAALVERPRPERSDRPRGNRRGAGAGAGAGRRG
jgi:small subunit ribosomal protein S3